MSQSLLALASATNEAAIAYRTAVDTNLRAASASLAFAPQVLKAVDALTSAIVERANEAPIEIPLDNLTRLREIEDVAAHRGVTIPEAVVLLVNSALSGTFLDGYRAAIEELQESAAEREAEAAHEAEVERRIDAHEQFLASPGADHLYEGRGE